MCNMRIYLILMRYTENNVNFRKGCAEKMFGENAKTCSGILFLLSWKVLGTVIIKVSCHVKAAAETMVSNLKIIGRRNREGWS